MNGIDAILDTHAIIYLHKGVLAEPLPEGVYAVSVMTEMELLSYPGLSSEQEAWLKRLFTDVRIIDLTPEVKERQSVSVVDQNIACQTRLSRQPRNFSTRNCLRMTRSYTK